SRGRREQQRVVVGGADEGIDRDEAVAAGAVFHHDGLAPSRGETVPDEPRGDIDTGSRPEWQNESDGSRRIGLRRGGRGREGADDERHGEGGQKPRLADHGIFSSRPISASITANNSGKLS